jgi:hypothetical protein
MINYKPKIESDTLDELGDALLKREKLALVHQKLRTMPSHLPNRDLHFSIVERRIWYVDQQIDILLNRLILLG